MTEPQRKLNEAQTAILRLFGREMDEEEIAELRDTLVDFLDKQLQKELDRVMREKNISPENISNLGIRGNRTEYLNEIRRQKSQ